MQFLFSFSRERRKYREKAVTGFGNDRKKAYFSV